MISTHIENNSSLISKVEFDSKSWDLTIYFKKYFIDKITYIDVEPEMFIDFVTSKSLGKFYLSQIKPNLQIKKSQNMTTDKVIKFKIDVTKLIKDYFFTGEKGIYANCTLLYSEKPDGNGNNGMVVQDVPTEVYKKDSSLKGPILGNAKEFPKGGSSSKESQPGTEGGTAGVSKESADDLPF